MHRHVSIRDLDDDLGMEERQMNDEMMKTILQLVEELATLRAQKKALIRMMENDDFINIEKDIVRRIFDEEVKE